MLIKIGNVKVTFLKLFFLIVLIPIILKYAYYKLTKFEEIVEVEDKYKNDLSFTENGLLFIKDKNNVFNVTNLFFKWDFNKEEDYNKLEKGKKYFVNVGSVGQPRDGDPRAGDVIYDLEAGTIEVRRLEYDIEKTQAKILEAGLPERVANRLASGR